jgi:hypothetical protein
MAIWNFKVDSWTLEAVAHTTTMAANKFAGLMGGSSTQRIKIREVLIGGQESATSSPVIVLLQRSSTVHITPTALDGVKESNAAADPATTTLSSPPVAFTTASTRPQRSSTLGIKGFSFNALGGVTRYRWPYGEEAIIQGNTASFGEVTLSGFTGSSLALVGGAIEYEPL